MEGTRFIKQMSRTQTSKSVDPDLETHQLGIAPTPSTLTRFQYAISYQRTLTNCIQGGGETPP